MRSNTIHFCLTIKVLLKLLVIHYIVSRYGRCVKQSCMKGNNALSHLRKVTFKFAIGLPLINLCRKALYLSCKKRDNYLHLINSPD